MAEREAKSGMDRDWSVLDRLWDTIADRRSADPSTSYVAKLFHKGPTKIAQKLGEEGLETALAAVAEGPKAVRGEAADLLFHLMVLLQQTGVDPADILDELARREGLSGLAEKAGRKG